MKYLALLRGINVGGKNKVAMSQLRVCFEAHGFTNVSTYISTGNVFFETEATDEAGLVHQCEAAIEAYFGFAVVVMVIAKPAFENAINHAPDWWGDLAQREKIRSEALFIISPTTTDEVLTVLDQRRRPGSPDQLSSYGQVIFWSLERNDYTKSIVPKIIGTPIYRRITIRSAATVKKLQQLFDDV